MDITELKRLLESVKESDIRELVLETSDYKLSVRRGGDAQVVSVASGPPPAISAAVPAVPPTTTAQLESPATAPVPTTAAPPPPAPSNLVEVTAPIVGTLYASPSPDEPAFVKVGDRVQAGAVLCIIEAMKLMNEIEAETAGVVREILVKNEEPVEYGQPLFRLEPA